MYGNYNHHWAGNFNQEHHSSPQNGAQPSAATFPVSFAYEYQISHPIQHSESSVTTTNLNWNCRDMRESLRHTWPPKTNQQSQQNSYQCSKSNQKPLNYSASLQWEKGSSFNLQELKNDQNNDSQNSGSTSLDSSFLNQTNYEYTSPLNSLEAKRAEKIPKSCEKEIPNNRRPPPIEVDPSLPSEIVALFKTNSCDLCSVKLNSRIQSKTHYEGKPHCKKLKAAVEEHTEKTSELSPLADEPEAHSASPPPKKKKKIGDGSQLYCKCCDLSFTSMDHATQHYLGRNHHRILHGLKPLKAGYYNKDTGKWQRMPPDPRTPTEQLTDPDDLSDPDSVKGKGRFFCELCCVSATSQEQLDGHLKGQKHKKAQQLADKQQNQSASSSVDSILSSLTKGEEAKEAKKIKSKDFSIFRTPSGKFYCAPCDITLNSESQFAQHVESKKHKIKK